MLKSKRIWMCVMEIRRISSRRYFMNARVGEIEVEDIVGKLEVSGMKENGQKLIEFCTRKKLSLEIRFLRSLIYMVERSGWW